jgi:hypothetical protein
MKVKIVTLSMNDKDVEYVVYREEERNGKSYDLLIPKILYFEMLQSLVDVSAIESSIVVYQKTEKGLYIKVEEEELLHDICSKRSEG